MERLEFNEKKPYQAIEGAIHMNRYLVAKKFCKGSRVLDVACGEGYGSYLISKWGAESVEGIDISAEAIRNAKLNFKMPNLNFTCESVEELTLFESKSFDLIVSLETIEHLQQPQKFLREIKRLIKPGGMIIISCPNDYYYYPTNEMKNPYHIRKYTINEFKDMTQSILGAYSAFYLGAPIGGFININENSALKKTDERNQLNMFQYKTNFESILLQQEEIINEKNCSYFIGIWGCNDNNMIETVALYPRGMDLK